MRILIVRTDRLGDVVLATPLIRALRKSFPEAHLAALVRAYAEPVLRGNPHLNEILIDDGDGVHGGWRGIVRLAAKLRRHRFDGALLLLPTKRLAYALFLAGIRVRIGVGRRLYQFLTGMSFVRRQLHPLRSEADYCLDLGRKIGAQDDGLATEVFLTDEELRRADEVLAAAGVARGDFLVGIHPGSGGSAPNWPAEYWANAARAIVAAAPNARIILTGVASERHHADAFRDVPGRIDFIGAHDLRLSMAILARLHVFASASTGTMHLAAAAGVPTVSTFCPLPACHPDLWGAQGNHAVHLLPHERYCQGDCPGDPKRCTFVGGIEPTDLVERVVRFRAEAGAGEA